MAKAILTVSPMVNTSIPMMVKRHRWMVSSSPTLGERMVLSLVQHRPHTRRGATPPCLWSQGWAQCSLLSLETLRIFSPGTGT